ncbi:ribose-5-phosphate isomerase RpiA [Novosphingobium album (ex Liu et al. 2023)]|uniref:Ribose-5-phosphate isomerase A n=1 Tax=Novosphingobium album (ex Liu et al. 2023) TaxID=3031130 RepID=A0ABT5WRX2_9SPHN|nr:ribose-5-phosphate isomerase RpiA [Novosphingobium album (ex Liu et al. 2023)]MDE8652787.1 ribose-5-phosphate isomerase RpiA [Novosphingobium album (ex Liu et al. 2023)]
MANCLQDSDDVVALKRAAAHAAVAEIESGMLVGLGTGTTVSLAIAALGERVLAGLRIDIVATSRITALQARAAGLSVLAFDTRAGVDLAIDGADELDPDLRAIKGRGGAMLREKIVAAAAARMVVIVDASKEVTALGRGLLPIETLPFAAGFVSRRIERLGAAVSLRMAGSAPFLTDQRNIVLDCRFGVIGDCEGLAQALSAIPGMLGHGLFLDEIDAAYVGRKDGIARLTRSAPGAAS